MSIPAANTWSEGPHVPLPAPVGREGDRRQRQRMARRGQGEERQAQAPSSHLLSEYCGEEAADQEPLQPWAHPFPSHGPVPSSENAQTRSSQPLPPPIPAFHWLFHDCSAQALEWGGVDREIQGPFCPQGVQPMSSPLLNELIHLLSIYYVPEASGRDRDHGLSFFGCCSFLSYTPCLNT